MPRRSKSAPREKASAPAVQGLRLLFLNLLVYLNQGDPVLRPYPSPAASESSGVPEPKRASVAAVPRASPAAGVPVPKRSSAPIAPKATSTAVAESPSVPEPKRPPKKKARPSSAVPEREVQSSERRERSRSPVGTAKKSAAKKPPAKKPPVKRPPVAREEPEVEESAPASLSSLVIPSEFHRGIIDKTALLVAKGGEGYEDPILREQDHSKFYFLKPSDVHRPYYEQKLAECRARIALASASGAPKAAAPENAGTPSCSVGLPPHHRV